MTTTETKQAAWATVDLKTGEIDVRTVSPTAIGAMVNWLWTDGKFFATSSMSDERLEKEFRDRCPRDVELTEVEITYRRKG